jgi:signal transduction histidine kinase
LRLLVWMLLGTVTVVGALSFYEFRRALQAEIASNLEFGASTVMQRVDIFMFSHVQNMLVWRDLEVMQDIRINDVDKRLSHFLSNLRAGQGTEYRSLLCTDDSGRIVAASDPALIGQQVPAASAWMRVPDAQLGDISIAPVQGSRAQVAMLRTPIANAFGKGTIGYLYVLVNWDTIRAVLDSAVAKGNRSLLLLDHDGQVIATSRSLRSGPENRQLRLRNWSLPAQGAISYIHRGRAIGLGELLVGAATSSGYQQFRGLGWHVLVVEPTAVSFAPIWRLLWAMVAVLLLTLMGGIWISSRVANRISRPIVALTEFARQFRQGAAQLPAVPETTISEVVELHHAYVEMIGALERSREQIVRAGKLAVAGEMAAIMAHEVRTPMGIVRSSAQLLERQPNLGEKERELIGFIISETERLNRLVTMLLECARPQPPDFRPHDLHAIIDGVLSLLASRAENAGVTLTRETSAVDMVLDCDREQMMQVFLNLILNALSFVSAGGRVAVSTYRDTDALWISVVDDGPGVPESLRPLVFDPFFSRREGGIGLGLTIVQQIVQVHGGEINIDESAWGGAAFNLRFKTP